MAGSTFTGWGDAWGTAWGGAADPNAMRGAATFAISAAGTITATGVQPEPAPTPEPAGGGLRTRRRIVSHAPWAPLDALLEDELELQLLGVM